MNHSYFIRHMENSKYERIVLTVMRWVVESFSNLRQSRLQLVKIYQSSHKEQENSTSFVNATYGPRGRRVGSSVRRLRTHQLS